MSDKTDACDPVAEDAPSVCVIGLGKIGLPLAAWIASVGCRVAGVDIDESIVLSVSSGNAPEPEEPGLAALVRDTVGSGLLTATASVAEASASADVVVIVVPMTLDEGGSADFGTLDTVTEEVAGAIRPGTLVVYETTLPVGATRRRFAPRLAERSGLTLGRDLFVCYSPERVYSGRVFADLQRYPKLVGGVDTESSRRGERFYRRVLQFQPRPDLARPNGVWLLGSCEAAELAKLAETTYRFLNIAYANELAIFADSVGVNVHAVIDASNSQPFSHIHSPGVAVGGHCIPVYPQFFRGMPREPQLPQLATQINASMPSYAVELLREAVGSLKGLTVVVLGASYRGGVRATALSGAFALVDALEESGAVARVHDPLFSDDEVSEMGWLPYRFGERCDAAILQADHEAYAHLRSEQLMGVRVVIDGRNSLERSPMRFEGVTVIAIGGGSGGPL